MSDNDLIRRGDAVKLLRDVVKNWSCGCDARYCRCSDAREHWDLAADEISDARALPAATPTTAAALALPEVRALVDILAEARSDLAVYVENDWPVFLREQAKSYKAKWERDMELCWRIDAALAPFKGGAA